ncbi:MAG: Hsp70 family protein [Deltaproteobacteria bacterium]|nr:Hsp70 family protein [Deltaproteobacteria bacterium]
MEKVLGIDAGTWSSSVAAIVDGRPRFLSGVPGSNRIPSAVSVDVRGAVYVGETARRRAVLEPYNTVLTPCRLLGRFPADAPVQRALAQAPVRIVAGPAGQVTVNLCDTVYAVPEIAGQLLGHLRDLAERGLGEAATKAVLAIPTCYGDAQRQALLLAARLGGIDVLRLVSSPVAAAISAIPVDGPAQRLLVVDAGGGQTGAAVIDWRGRVVEVMGQAGEAGVGALDVDAAVCGALAEEFELNMGGGELQRNLSARARLLFATESAKRSLAQHEQVRIRLREFIKTAEWHVDFDSFLDRATVDRMAQAYAESVLTVADAALQSAGAEPDSIDALVLVGGGAQIKSVQRDLRALVGRDPIAIDDSEACVVAGAAKLAMSLTGNPSMSVEDVKQVVIEAMSADLSIAAAGGYRETLIPAGVRLPIAAHRVFTTSQDGQTQVRIMFFQGAQGAANEDCMLGEFVLDGLKAARRGEVRIDVGFEIDCDGLLHVSARDLETGHRTASDVRISQAVTEQALAAVREARGLNEDTLRNPIGGQRAGRPVPTTEHGEKQ